MDKRDCIIFIGPPGCGKSTQAKSLASVVSGLHHISTGKLIRDKLKDFSGNYRGDDVIRGLLVDEINSVNAKLYVLDGVPRTLSQVGVVEDFFNVKNVFYFDNLTERVLRDRMKSRGRVEDFSKRINDFFANTACLQSFYSITRPDLYVRLDGSAEPSVNTMKILQYI